MLKVAVCDNEEMTMDLLEKGISRFTRRFDIDMLIHTYTSGEKLLSSEKRYDVVFLEIGQHPEEDLQIGFQLRKKNKELIIILVSYLEHYMKQAFQMHAFSYLQKPVSLKQLYYVFDDIISCFGSRICEIPVLKFQLKEGVKAFAVNEIAFFEYCNRNVLIHDCENRIYEIQREKISNIASRMKEYHFEVPHKSFVVNMMFVDYIKGYQVFMKNGEVLPLSQHNSKKFRKMKFSFIEQD